MMFRGLSHAAVVLAATLISPPPAFSQEVSGILNDYTTNSWTEKDGLPSDRISAVAQTPDEFLWLGTNAGLVRFDGVKFVEWKELSDEPLPSLRVRVLFTAADGSLWVGFNTPGGVSRIKDGQVTNFNDSNGMAGGAIESLAEDDDGSIWASAHAGLFHYQHAGWQQIAPQSGLPEGSVSSCFKDSRGNLWVSTTDAIFRRLKGHAQFERITPASYWSHRLMEDGSGAIWITDPRVGLRTLLSHVDASAPAAVPVKTASGADGLGVQILPDSHGNIWIATLGRGLWRMRTSETGRPIDTLSNDTGLISNSVRALLEDHKGSLWVATDNGLQQLSRKRLTGLTNLGLVRVIERGADDSIWVGTTSGLVRFKNGKETRYGTADLPSAFVTALHADHSGNLWIVTDSGMVRFANERFTRLDVPHQQLTRVYSITTDQSGNLWLCDTNHGLFVWTGTTLKPVDVPSQFDHRTVTWVGGDAFDRVWLNSSTAGLVMVDNNGARRQFKWGSGTDWVWQESRNSPAWLSSAEGAGRFDGRELVTIGQPNGLPTSSILSVVPGNDGHLWLATPIGIIRVQDNAFDLVKRDPAAKIDYTLYNTEDGMAGMPVPFGSRGSVRSVDGRMWFVTTDGITIVDPALVLEDPSLPPVHIEGLVADARRLGRGPGLELPPNTSTIEIDYSAVTFSSPKKVRYRYRLDGFDHEWQEVGARREAFYTNLGPGRYRFRVAAANTEKGFASEGVPIDFVLLPTFYQTWWFYLASALTLVMVLWLGLRFRLRHLHREFSLVLGERVRVSREIHDTLLQGLVGVGLQLDALSAAETPVSTMKELLAATRGEVQEFIRETRQSIWNLRSPKLQRSDLAAALRQTGERATSGTPVQFTLTTTGQTQAVASDVEQHLLRIGEQAVLNSIRHSNASEVHVKLQYSDDEVRLRVWDNGRGFDPSDLSTSDHHYGLVGMKERTDQVGGQLNVISHPGGGTAVEVVIPVAAEE